MPNSRELKLETLTRSNLGSSTNVECTSVDVPVNVFLIYMGFDRLSG